MRKLNTSAALLAASAVVSGCAAGGYSFGSFGGGLKWGDVAGSRGAVVLAETPAPAPAGLAAFCERMAAACNGGAVAADAPELRRTAWDATQATSAVRRAGSGEDGAAIFARMLAIRAQGGVSASERHEVALTETLWNELETVNREVNRAIAARSDQNRYGVAEYWAMPLAERLTPNDPAEGDCEDYALEKRARLIQLGWNADALALAVANAPGVGMHAVLIAQTDHGDFVLDNLHEGPRPPETLDYRWVSRQAGPSMAQWASARVALAPNAPPRRGADMLLAALEPAAGGGQPVALLSTVVKARS